MMDKYARLGNEYREAISELASAAGWQEEQAGKVLAVILDASERKMRAVSEQRKAERKSMIVVPNHLTGQWASEFLRLYPNANILVTTRRDFEKDTRPNPWLIGGVALLMLACAGRLLWYIRKHRRV